MVEWCEILYDVGEFLTFVKLNWKDLVKLFMF
jgi:hypothetical protein